MHCHVHAEVPATATCAGCAEAFCDNCLVTIKGTRYCGSCKMMAIPAGSFPLLQECKLAKEALIYSVLGIFCLGPVLAPMAIHRALKAKQLLKANPSLEGRAKANAALIVSALVLVFWVIGIRQRFIK